MATPKNPAKTLMSSFKELGMTAAQVRHFVPAWWDDEAALDEGGLLELQILLARRLNVALESLQIATPKPVFRDAARRFKTIHPDGSTQLAVAAGVGHGLAHMVASACPFDALVEPQQAPKVRAEILKKNAAVTLEALCRWLWEHGIPVVHILEWPKQLRRPDAMCVSVGHRPIILVVRNESTPARLTYLVAHELGHIMSGHLRADTNAVLVDETLPVDAQDVAKDEDETVADTFAMELLGGTQLRQAASQVGRQFDEAMLTAAALKVSKGSALDPGQVILGWARLTNDWKLAGMAMRYLMTTQAAPVVLNEIAKRYINPDALSSDGRDHLARLTGVTFDDE